MRVKLIIKYNPFILIQVIVENKKILMATEDIQCMQF